MNFYYLCFFFGFLMGLSHFSKKLIFLLSLETMMIFLIGIFFFSLFQMVGNSSFSILLILLTFMVLDSVLGISLLISSSRGGSNISSFSSFF